MKPIELQLKIFFASSVYGRFYPGDWHELFITTSPFNKIFFGRSESSGQPSIANSNYQIENGDRLKVFNRANHYAEIVKEEDRTHAISEISVQIPKIYETLGMTPPLSDWKIVNSTTLNSFSNEYFVEIYLNNNEQCMIKLLIILIGKNSIEAAIGICFDETKLDFIALLRDTLRENGIEIQFIQRNPLTYSIKLANTTQPEIMKTFNTVFKTLNALEPISPAVFQFIENTALTMHDLYLNGREPALERRLNTASALIFRNQLDSLPSPGAVNPTL